MPSSVYLELLKGTCSGSWCGSAENCAGLVLWIFSCSA